MRIIACSRKRRLRLIARGRPAIACIFAAIVRSEFSSSTVVVAMIAVTRMIMSTVMMSTVVMCRVSGMGMRVGDKRRDDGHAQYQRHGIP